MNYETNTFGLDVIFAVTSKSEPYLLKERTDLNQTFLEFRTNLESEASSFLIEYYQTLLQGKYLNKDKMCTIKELEMKEEDPEEERDFIVKKNEDEKDDI